MSEIITVRNGFILRPDREDFGTSIQSSTIDTFVFNNAKDLGKHITDNFKTLEEKESK